MSYRKYPRRGSTYRNVPEVISSAGGGGGGGEEGGDQAVTPGSILTAEEFGNVVVELAGGDPYPVYTAFDRQVFHDELLTDGFDTEDWPVDFPTLPTASNTVVVNEATPSATRTAFNTACATPGNRVIVLSTMQGAGAVSLNSRSDLDIILAPGVRIDQLNMVNVSGVGAKQVRVRGGEIQHVESVSADTEDIIFDGCVIASNRWSVVHYLGVLLQRFLGAGGSNDRWSLVNCVIRGNVSGENANGAGVETDTTTQLFIAGCAIMGRIAGGDGSGNWSCRYSQDDYALEVDNWMYTGRSFVSRGGSTVARYTTSGRRAGDRAKYINLTSPSNIWGALEDALLFERSVDVVADPLGVWDPQGAFEPLECVQRDVGWYVRQASQMSSTVLSNREAQAVAPQRWSITNDPVFDYSGAGTPPTIPDPPTIVSQGLIDASELHASLAAYADGEPRCLIGGVVTAISDPRDLVSEI